MKIEIGIDENQSGFSHIWKIFGRRQGVAMWASEQKDKGFDPIVESPAIKGNLEDFDMDNEKTVPSALMARDYGLKPMKPSNSPFVLKIGILAVVLLFLVLLYKR